MRASDDLPEGDIGALLRFLQTSDAAASAKNRALRCLVAAANEPSDFAVTSTNLIHVALWPGLDAARSRIGRRYPRYASELDAELIGRLVLGIRTLDLSRVDRIAATLLRNVERDIVRDICRQTREAPSGIPVENILETRGMEPVFAAPSADTDASCSALYARLLGVIDDDAALVTAVAVYGFSQHEAADLLGLTHDAARKRYQRACARLREIW